MSLPMRLQQRRQAVVRMERHSFTHNYIIEKAPRKRGLFLLRFKPEIDVIERLHCISCSDVVLMVKLVGCVSCGPDSCNVRLLITRVRYDMSNSVYLHEPACEFRIRHDSDLHKNSGNRKSSFLRSINIPDREARDELLTFDAHGLGLRKYMHVGVLPRFLDGYRVSLEVFPTMNQGNFAAIRKKLERGFKAGISTPYDCKVLAAKKRAVAGSTVRNTFMLKRVSSRNFQLLPCCSRGDKYGSAFKGLSAFSRCREDSAVLCEFLNPLSLNNFYEFTFHCVQMRLERF